MKAIIVSGSVATGKTTFAKKLAKKHNYEYLDVNSLIKENKIYDSYDKKRKCYVVDTNKLNRKIIDFFDLTNFDLEVRNDVKKLLVQ